MISATFAIVFVTALFLAFSETRLMGVFGIAVLAYLHPLLLITVAVVGVVVAVLFQLYRRRSYHALPGPDSEID